jgi:hypothetical protein
MNLKRYLNRIYNHDHIIIYQKIFNLKSKLQKLIKKKYFEDLNKTNAHNNQNNSNSYLQIIK